MKTFIIVLFFTLVGCSTPKFTYSDNQKTDIGKIVKISFLGDKFYRTTFIQTEKTDVQIDGKIRRLNNGDQCYIVEKNGGRDLYLIVEGNDKVWEINHY